MLTAKDRKTEDMRFRREGSFTLIETVIALAIVTFLIIEVSAVQGNSIVFHDYSRNVTQATWLARRVMSQVEYYWQSKPFKELETNLRDQRFEDTEEYTYNLEIKEWKFPFVALLSTALGGGGGGGEDGEKKEEAGGGVSQMIESVVKQIFGDEPIFLTAFVEVNWSEGAQKNGTSMTYLLTNQAKLDEAITMLKPVYDKLTKPPAKKNDSKKADGRTSGQGGQGGGAGTNPDSGQPLPDGG